MHLEQKNRNVCAIGPTATLFFWRGVRCSLCGRTLAFGYCFLTFFTIKCCPPVFPNHSSLLPILCVFRPQIGSKCFNLVSLWGKSMGVFRFFFIFVTLVIFFVFNGFKTQHFLIFEEISQNQHFYKKILTRTHNLPEHTHTHTPMAQVLP